MNADERRSERKINLFFSDLRSSAFIGGE